MREVPGGQVDRREYGGLEEERGHVRKPVAMRDRAAGESREGGMDRDR